MATESAINALLDTAGQGKGARIQAANYMTATKSVYYVQGNWSYPGKAKWVTCTTSDNDATQAAAIQSAMAL